MLTFKLVLNLYELSEGTNYGLAIQFFQLVFEITANFLQITLKKEKKM